MIHAIQSSRLDPMIILQAHRMLKSKTPNQHPSLQRLCSVGAYHSGILICFSASVYLPIKQMSSKLLLARINRVIHHARISPRCTLRIDHQLRCCHNTSDIEKINEQCAYFPIASCAFQLHKMPTDRMGLLPVGRSQIGSRSCPSALIPPVRPPLR